DRVAERVLGERAPARVLADRARLVRMGQMEVELAPQLAEVAVAHDLLARLEEVLEVFLEIHDLARRGRRQLEGARVYADDVVHRMVVVERERGRRIHEELLAPEDRRPRDPADGRVLGRGPAGPPETQRVVAPRLHEVLPIGIAVADERD